MTRQPPRTTRPPWAGLRCTPRTSQLQLQPRRFGPSRGELLCPASRPRLPVVPPPRAAHIGTGPAHVQLRAARFRAARSREAGRCARAGAARRKGCGLPARGRGLALGAGLQSWARHSGTVRGKGRGRDAGPRRYPPCPPALPQQTPLQLKRKDQLLMCCHHSWVELSKSLKYMRIRQNLLFSSPDKENSWSFTLLLAAKYRSVREQITPKNFYATKS